MFLWPENHAPRATRVILYSMVFDKPELVFRIWFCNGESGTNSFGIVRRNISNIWMTNHESSTYGHSPQVKRSSRWNNFGEEHKAHSWVIYLCLGNRRLDILVIYILRASSGMPCFCSAYRYKRTENYNYPSMFFVAREIAVELRANYYFGILY